MFRWVPPVARRERIRPERGGGISYLVRPAALQRPTRYWTKIDDGNVLVLIE